MFRDILFFLVFGALAFLGLSVTVFAPLLSTLQQVLTAN